MSNKSQNFTRRDLLLSALSATAVGVLPALPGPARAQTVPAVPAVPPADAQFTKLLDSFAEEILRLSPTTATSLGLDKGERAGLKSQLDNLSRAGDAAWAGQVKSMLKRLSGVERAKLGADAQIRYDTIRYAANEGLEGLRFSYGGAAAGFNGGTSPFPVTQQDGAVLRMPEFLHSQHQIADAADAEAYLERVTGMARMLDQESARIADQASRGILPPNFIARTALGQMQDYRKVAVAQQNWSPRSPSAPKNWAWRATGTRASRRWSKPRSTRRWSARSPPTPRPRPRPPTSPACTACRTARPTTSGRCTSAPRPI